MNSCSTDDMVLADGTISPSMSTMAPPAASTPGSGQPLTQLGQCVYVLSPWRRGRTVFTGQPPPQNSPGFRFQHPAPAPVSLLRLAPYRPYYPSVPPQTPGAGLPRDLPQEYRYDFYNNAYPGTADYAAYTAGQDVQQTEESTSQTNFESMYTPAYPPQASLYPYSQQQCWGHSTTVGYNAGESEKSRPLAYYPERVGKLGGQAEYVPVDSNGPGTRKNVRVKFMGPEAMYLTTKTSMQPGCGSLNDPGTGNIQVYENLQSSNFSDDALGLNEVVIQTSADEDATQEHGDGQERVTFGSIEEALASIDPIAGETPPQPVPALVDKSYLQVSAVSYQGLRMADGKQEEIIKAAKSLFSKRTRTLYHWLYPQTSKNKLKATVSAAWDTLHENEKQFYVSQVLGRFGLQASSLMINPQLDGIKGLPTEIVCPSTADRPRHIPPPQETGKMASAVEAQQAVDQLFASCADSESWTSYSGSSSANAVPIMSIQMPTPAATPLFHPPVIHVPSTAPPRSTKTRSSCGSSQNNKRKRNHSRVAETADQARLGPINDHLDEEVTILRRMRESKFDADFDEDSDLTNELEKFRVMAQDSDRNSNGDDFWRRTPDPEELFTHLEF